jgi:hypothetical protein
MTEDKLDSIEQYARTLPNPIFAMDVEQLVAEVKRLRALLTETAPVFSDLMWIAEHRGPNTPEQKALEERLRQISTGL